MRSHRLTTWQRLWRPFWALPLAIGIVAVAAGVLLPLVDGALSEHVPYVFQGGSDGARGLLSTIATAMISVTGLVFSITMVVLQLASSQFTPRVLGGFLSQRTTQVTLGIFIASFVFALTVLRSVRGGADGFVPQLSVTVAFLLVLASMGSFIAFIHHITVSIQVSTVISGIGDRAVALVDELYPDAAPVAESTWSPALGTPHAAVTSGGDHGAVTEIDVDVLVSLARELGVVVVAEVQVGDFVTEEMTVVTVWGSGDLADRARARVRGAVLLETQRTMRQDPGFGIRQLVDIAERALSPGVNDPTTAVQAVDELHRILRVLVTRRTPSRYASDEDGAVRVVLRPQAVGDLVNLATEEVLHYGRDSVQVPRRVEAMVDDLLTVALPDHRAALARVRERMDVVTPG
ncbi:hypothetical protein N864_16930 [Intrasporangium chromatireducens Q5-1]|uniref:DUF2254 domain-containing protein n=1 Tax=Intrasporangium chromatireducens Q5-1 TaxID=584657 RepID=W9GCZ9_9MICO|nr:DUF2254 domain-containing protein [Intrasporangium chromatireducens]EWT03950.1 hypothetical protein N864_16930 [Intrasporangium chromatireducens Q5-1]